MTVESASYISQLDTTLPTAADLISEGDDHLRLTKTVLKTQFPNFGATAITASAAEVNYLVGVTSAIQPQLSNQVAGPVHAATAKTTPVDADELGITDSAASWGLKKLTFANLKAWIGSFFVSKSGDTIGGNLSVTGNVGIGRTPTTVRLEVAGKQWVQDATLPATFWGNTLADYLAAYYDPATKIGYVGTDGAGTQIVLKTFSTERLRIDTSGNVLVTGGGGLGYGVGSGGTVTQATSKSTKVTLNKPSGLITLSNSELLAGQTVSFIFENSLVVSPTLVLVTQFASYPAKNYQIWGSTDGAGSAIINVKNISSGALSEPLDLLFVLVKGAVS